MINRLRHRYGFGVHSPFAYELIREVVTPHRGYAYYAELKMRDEHSRREYRLREFLKRHRLEGARHISGPTEEQTEEARRLISERGGVLLLGRGYLIAVPREGMEAIEYRV